MWIVLTCVLGCFLLLDPLHMGRTVDGKQSDVVCSARDGAQLHVVVVVVDVA